MFLRPLLCGLVMALLVSGCDLNDKPVKQWDSLGSPRQTIFTFLQAAAQVKRGHLDALPRVHKTFDLTGDSREELADHAEMLLGVFDRIGEISPENIPGAEEIRETGDKRYVFFPREAHAWIYKELDGKPDGRIVLTVDSEGNWRFTADTVDGIAALYASMEGIPQRYDQRESNSDLITLVGPTFSQTQWWHWLALLGCIFVGVVIGKIAQVSFRKTADRLSNRNWNARATTIRSLASPASLACLSFGILIGLDFIYMEDGMDDFAGRIVRFLLILAGGWYLYNLVDVVNDAMVRFTATTETTLDDMIVPLVRKTLRIFLVIIFTLFVAQTVFGLDVTSWLAGLGIAGLAVSLAAQDSVKNLFGSITIFFDKPFLVDDYITFDGFSGTVEEIGFRSTRLRLLSGHLVTIPNMKFIDGNVENISKRPYIRRQMDVTITYDTPPAKIEEAIEILRDILFNDADIVEQGKFDMDDKPPKLAFNELNADSLNIRAYYWYQLVGDPDRGFFSFIEHAQMVNMKLFQRYGDAGIEFAFPTQTLYLAGDPARELKVTVDNNTA